MKINLVGTKRVVELCKKIINLQSFVHVSTAYANCNRSFINEEVYDPPVDPEKLINFAEWVPKDLSELITPKLIHPRPNTYTFTKAIAESYVKQECEGKMPVAIVRPAAVGAAFQEPVPGWVDSYSAGTTIFASMGRGMLKSMIGDPKGNADIIPVDISVNMIIVAGYVFFFFSNFSQIKCYKKIYF